jgi:hypothetical protein
MTSNLEEEYFAREEAEKLHRLHKEKETLLYSGKAKIGSEKIWAWL